MSSTRRHVRPGALAAAIAVALLGAACGDEGTISFALVFPRGTTRLPAEAVRARLTLDNPASVREADIAADGSFALALDVEAVGTSGRVTFEALDADGAAVARGTSPPLPIAAFEDDFRLYVAPPKAFAEAPPEPPAARTELAAASLTLGALLAGGVDESGAPTATARVYDVYTHELLPAADMPSPRAAQAAQTGNFGIVYFYGGRDADGSPTADLWAFQSDVQPAGAWSTRQASADLARAGAQLAPLGGELFLVTGDPPAVVDVGPGEVGAIDGALDAARTATTATSVVSEGTAVALLLGPDGATRFDADSNTFAPLTSEGASGRRDQGATRLASARAIAVGGASPVDGTPLADAVSLTPTGAQTIPLLARARTQPAVAVTERYLVVAGGFDAAGNALDDAELFERDTLAPAGTVPLVAPRGGAVAVPLSNGSILLAGGRSSIGGPIAATLELFTP